MSLKHFVDNYETKPVVKFFSLTPKNPLVSVCVQTYQHAPFIRECLDSILKQETSFSFEILIGEDDSKDDTREICVEYAERYPEKIQFFLHNRDNNINIAGRATGRFNAIYNLYNAKGKYIAICEGDDYWTDTKKLQRQVDFLENNSDYSVCYTLAKRTDGKDIKKSYMTRNSRKISFPFHYDFSYGIQSKGGPTLTMLFRSSALNYDLIKHSATKTAMGDWPLEVTLLQSGKGCCLEEETAMYRVHDHGATATSLNAQRYYESREMVCLELLDKKISDNNKLIIRKFLHRLYLQWSLLFYSQKKLSSAVTYLNKSLKFLPSIFNKSVRMPWIKMYTYRSIIIHFGKLSILNILPRSIHRFLPKRLQNNIR